jgi:hypothetical protein
MISDEEFFAALAAEGPLGSALIMVQELAKEAGEKYLACVARHYVACREADFEQAAELAKLIQVVAPMLVNAHHQLAALERPEVQT